VGRCSHKMGGRFLRLHNMDFRNNISNCYYFFHFKWIYCGYKTLHVHGHVARFPAGDPAGRILSVREPAGRTRPVGRPYDTWLRQMDRHYAGGGDGSCGGLEDGHQGTEGVPLEGRCGDTLLWHMLPLTN